MPAAQLDPIQLKADLDVMLPVLTKGLAEPAAIWELGEPFVVAANRRVAWLQSVADDPVALPALCATYNNIVATKPSP